VTSYVDYRLASPANAEPIDLWVQRWHEGDGWGSLHEFLGMTRDEYASWVRDASYLDRVLASRRMALASR